MSWLKTSGYVITLFGMGFLIWNLYTSFSGGKVSGLYTTMGCSLVAIGAIVIKKYRQNIQR